MPGTALAVSGSLGAADGFAVVPVCIGDANGAGWTWFSDDVTCAPSVAVTVIAPALSDADANLPSRRPGLGVWY
jgi:hypothetical protein